MVGGDPLLQLVGGRYCYLIFGSLVALGQEAAESKGEGLVAVASEILLVVAAEDGRRRKRSCMSQSGMVEHTRYMGNLLVEGVGQGVDRAHQRVAFPEDKSLDEDDHLDQLPCCAY